MDINELFKKTETSYDSMLSEIIESQSLIKGMLQSIIVELSNNDNNKENEMLELANKLKDKDLLRVVARFSIQNPD